ncbi:MAG TPA: DUF4038 domain-containing protein, partial [Terriglobales bacterium]
MKGGQPSVCQMAMIVGLGKTHAQVQYASMLRLRCCVSVALQILTLLLTGNHAFAVDAERLRVSDNHRYLEYQNGKPFFYLADTAWALFHSLNREEAIRYLTNRAQKGFTVIQATVLAEANGLTAPNPYGDLPLIGGDPAKPNEPYFRHVDFIVNKAAEVGLVIGMLPTWGNYWAS